MYPRLRHAFVIASVLLAGQTLAACERTHVEPVPLATSAAARGEDLATIKLDRVRFNIERGQQIGTYRDNNFKLCGQSMLPQPIHWAAGKVTVRDEEMVDSFYQVLKSANYNVVGDPDALFANYDDADKAAEYLIGGRVDAIALDVCDEVTFGLHWKGVQSGRGRVDVTWQLYSTLDERVVLETQTSGSAEIEEGVPEGEVAIILKAFAAAARNLAGDPGFHNALVRRNVSASATKPAAPLSGWGEAGSPTSLVLAPVPAFASPIGSNMSRIQASVVTILTGSAQGSGFFIAPDLVLTNHHVAQDAARLKIVLVNGMEAYATTLRSDRKRDVALLKVDGGSFTPLPLRPAPVAITEEVYAVGSPLNPTLAGTVTRGIVSQIQQNSHGMPLIQADATIQPGSSGGPLLDAQGNVVGISQSGLTDDGEHLVGINFFIPIADALQRLKLQTE